MALIGEMQYLTIGGNTYSLPSGGGGTVTSVAVSNATNGGLSVSGSPISSSGTITIGHSNVLSSAQTTQAVYPIKIDKNGHISGYGTAINLNEYAQLAGASFTGPVTFGDSVTADELETGDLVVTGAASFTNNINANTINGVAVGNSPKFTDTVTTATTTGSGNAVTAITASNGALTVTKGITFLTSHQDISGKADKSATVSNVAYDSTNAKITKTINGTTSDVVTVATLKSALGSMPASDVYSWAKASTKPSYTASEVGALASNTTYVSTVTTTAGTHSAISSKSGAVSFNVPTKTSHLTNDSGFITASHTSTYSLPLAASGTRGGVQIGYSESGTNYAVKLSSEKMYVTVPWTDTKVTNTTATAATTYYLTGSTSSTTATGGLSKHASLAAYTTADTATSGYTQLRLGNTTVTSSAGGKEGQIRLYGTTATYYVDLKAGAPSANRTITFPNATGTVALISDIPTVSYPVTSVNSKTGAVSLTASDVGALPSSTTIPSTYSLGVYPTSGSSNNHQWNQDFGTKLYFKAGTSMGIAIDGSTLTFNATVPTKTSDLTNDSGFITASHTSTYSLPLAASGTRGGVQIGYSESGTNYAVKLSSEKMYVTVPWTDTKVTTAALTSGTTYYPILATGAGTATRQIDSTLGGLKYVSTAGTTSAVGTATLNLGNATASGTANNEKGILRLYGTGATYYTDLVSGTPTANRTITLPNASGTVSLLANLVDGSGTGTIRHKNASTTIGNFSFAEGERCEASGDHAHAEGEGTIASGGDCHAEGLDTTATGLAAHAEGEDSYASGYHSHAQNRGTIAAGGYQTALGKWNISDTTNAVILGNGTSDSARSNALTVDWNGNVNIASGAAYKINGNALTASDVSAVPTSQIDSGYIELSSAVAASSYTDITVSFGKTFSSTPKVVVGFYSTSTAGTFGRCNCAVHTITTTGCKIRFFNGDTSSRQPGFYWIATNVT